MHNGHAFDPAHAAEELFSQTGWQASGDEQFVTLPASMAEAYHTMVERSYPGTSRVSHNLMGVANFYVSNDTLQTMAEQPEDSHDQFVIPIAALKARSMVAERIARQRAMETNSAEIAR